jgi:PAS domain S-box-containing protein
MTGAHRGSPHDSALALAGPAEAVGAPADPGGRSGFPGRVLDSFGGGTTNWTRLGLALAAMATYIVAFIPPFSPEDANIAQLAATPIVVFAWLFGFWGGILAAVVILPFNAFLFSMVTEQTWAQVLNAQDDLLPSVLLLVLGAVLGGLRDIADQMRRELLARTEVEEARRESEERYRFVAESASDGIITLDQSRRILFANRAAEKIFGMPISDMLGRPFSGLIPEEGRGEQDAALEDYLNRVVTGSPEQGLQITGAGADRRESELEITFGDYVKDSEHVFTGVVRDVTARKRFELALQRAKEDAEGANRAKSEFLSRMSHELRTPLNAILGFAQLMALEDLDEEQAENVEQILKAGRHLLALVDEVLDIARIEAGRMSLSMEPVDVDGVVRETWELVRHRAQTDGVTLTEGEPVGCRARVRADRQRLKQVLLNLLSNAVKYNRENGQVAIRCSQGQTGPDRIRVSVSDTGPGIPDQAMDRLFRPFERLGADASGIEGTGIGLAVSRGLVEAMKGEIGVESSVGQGSTFWFELPLDTAQELEDAPVDEPDDEPAALEPAGRMSRILYIEDNPSNFMLVERVLGRRPDVELVTARNGATGLATARETGPDLILLDLHLPDMHGAEVMGRIKKDARMAGTPVIIITADVTGDRAKDLLAAGAAAYLSKPLDVREFLDVVDNLLE